MTRQLAPRALLAAAVMLTACADAGDRLAPPARPAFAEFALVEDGTYNTYGRDVTLTMYGGYAETGGQEVVLQQQFAEDHVWQSTDYDATVTFPAPDNTFGTAAPEEIDVGRIYTAVDGATTAFDRQGAVVQTTDGEVDSFEGATGGTGAPAYSRAPASRAVNARSVERAPRDKREPVDRVLVTARGSQRALARLRATSQERPGANGLLVFTRREDNTDVEETWDPGLGAVKEIRGRDDRGQEMRTEHRYERTGKMLVLSEEHTTIRDARGGLVGRFTLGYRNHRIR